MKFSVKSNIPERKLVGVINNKRNLLWFYKGSGLWCLEAPLHIHKSSYSSLEEVISRCVATPIYEGDVVEIQF